MYLNGVKKIIIKDFLETSNRSLSVLLERINTMWWSVRYLDPSNRVCFVTGLTKGCSKCKYANGKCAEQEGLSSTEEVEELLELARSYRKEVILE